MNARPALWTAWELVIVLATLFAIKAAMLQFDALWTYAGPISLVVSTIVATAILRKNGERWTDLGLARPRRMSSLLLWSLGALIITIAAGAFIEAAISAGDFRVDVVDPRYARRFADLPGNASMLVQWLAISWIVGAFVEEMLFRGMLISRFERLIPSVASRSWVAVALQAILFGQQHYYYQGLTGALATGGIALVSGGIFLRSGRTLWPLILSHGVANTIGLTLIFAGVQATR